MVLPLRDPYVKIKKLRDSAILPVRATPDAAGLDLFSAEAVVLQPGARAVIPTGCAVAIPAGHVGLIWPRSGLAAKSGIDVLAGVIDADYRGELGVVLVNHGGEPVALSSGMRIAQLLVQPVAMPVPVEAGELGDTVRGAGGYGSTGVGA